MDFLLEITSNHIFLYIILFLASFFDAFIFTSLFVVWEFFYISGWYLWFEYLDILIVYIILVISSIIWDNLSYFLWKKYWRKIFLRNWKFFNEKQLKRWEKLIEKYWEKIIFLSRFIWVFHWIIPFISWTFHQNYKKFFIFNLFWILIWIFHFMVYWYFFAKWFAYFWDSVFLNILLFLVFFYILMIFFYKVFFFLKEKKYLKIISLFFKFFLWFFLFFVLVLFYYYFYLYPKEAKFYDKNIIISDLTEYLKNISKKVYSDKIIKTNSNPINLVLITSKDLDFIMSEIWWKKNMSFSSWKINIFKFIELFFDKTLPISDFYHNDYNQNFQYQDFSKSTKTRNHIRFWQVWKNLNWENIYLGSISKDKNFTIMINNWLPIIWHSIYRNIDLTRDYFLSLIEKKFWEKKIEKIDFPSFQKKNYFTDWDIFIIKID